MRSVTGKSEKSRFFRFPGSPLKNGKRHGWGEQKFRNGDSYRGYWIYDRKDEIRTDPTKLVSLGFVQVDTGVYFKPLGKENDGGGNYMWHQAYAACEELLPGAKLATLRSKQECDFIKSNTNVLGKFYWLDIKAPSQSNKSNKDAFKNGNNGRAVDASCWESGQPSRYKYVYFTNDGLENYFSEWAKYNALCEYRL